MKILLLFIALITSDVYSQSPKKIIKIRRAEDFFSIQANNLDKVDLGMTKQQVVEIMGESVTISFNVQGGIGREKADIPQPKYRDLVKDENGDNIEILWYITDSKNAKEGCSPIILENNKVVGMGWAVFEDYTKRKKIEISVN